MCFLMLCNICLMNKLKNTYYRISFSCAHTNLSISSYKLFLSFSLTSFKFNFAVCLKLHLYIYLNIISDKLDVSFFLTVSRLNKNSIYHLPIQTLIFVAIVDWFSVLVCSSLYSPNAQKRRRGDE